MEMDGGGRANRGNPLPMLSLSLSLSLSAGFILHGVYSLAYITRSLSHYSWILQDISIKDRPKLWSGSSWWVGWWWWWGWGARNEYAMLFFVRASEKRKIQCVDLRDESRCCKLPQQETLKMLRSWIWFLEASLIEYDSVCGYMERSEVIAHAQGR